MSRNRNRRVADSAGLRRAVIAVEAPADRLVMLSEDYDLGGES